MNAKQDREALYLLRDQEETNQELLDLALENSCYRSVYYLLRRGHNFNKKNIEIARQNIGELFAKNIQSYRRNKLLIDYSREARSYRDLVEYLSLYRVKV